MNITHTTKNNPGRPKKSASKKVHGKDKITCDICYKIYSRHNAHNHRLTKFHQIHNNIIEALKHSIKDFQGVRDFKDLIYDPHTDKNGNVVYLSKFQQNFYNKLPHKSYKPCKKNIDI